MAIYDYQIGSTAETLEDLEGLIDSMCRGEFNRWPVRYIGANGRQYGDGLPVAVWHFDWISQADLNELREFWIEDNVYLVSQEMAIRTRMDDGLFGVFTCIGHWPDGIEKKRVPGNFYQNVQLEFTQLVYVPEEEP